MIITAVTFERRNTQTDYENTPLLKSVHSEMLLVWYNQQLVVLMLANSCCVTDIKIPNSYQKPYVLYNILPASTHCSTPPFPGFSVFPPAHPGGRGVESAGPDRPGVGRPG